VIAKLYQRCKKDGGLDKNGRFFDQQYEDAINGWVGYIRYRLTGEASDVVALNVKSFTRRAKGYTTKQGESAKKNQARINELAVAEIMRNVPEGGAVLDAGCADGIRTKGLQTRAESQGRHYTSYGVDISPKMVSLARKNEVNNVEAGNLTDLPFPGVSFGAITCLDGTLGHLKTEDRAEALRQMFRRLKVGGSLVLDVFNQEGYFNVKTRKMDAVRVAFQPLLAQLGENDFGTGDYMYFVQGSKDPCYMHHFTRAGISDDVKAAGFTISGVRTVGLGAYKGKDYGGELDEDFNKASLVVIAKKTM
jgi:SAM-dependent methyltransferase